MGLTGGVEQKNAIVSSVVATAVDGEASFEYKSRQMKTPRSNDEDVMAQEAKPAFKGMAENKWLKIKEGSLYKL